MEFLLGTACALLAVALVVVLPIVAIGMTFGQRGRINELERRLGELEAELVRLRPSGQRETPRVAPAGARSVPLPEAPPVEPTARPAEPLVADTVVPAPETAAELPPPAPDPVPDEPPSSQPSAPEPPPDVPPKAAPKPSFADSIGVWILAVPGGLALLLAAIFALREAILAGFVGPGVRFALGALVATTAVLAGELARWRRHEIPAAALSGAGAGTPSACRTLCT